MTLQRRTLIAALLIVLVGLTLIVVSLVALDTEPKQQTYKILFWLAVALMIPGSVAVVIAGRSKRVLDQEN